MPVAFANMQLCGQQNDVYMQCSIGYLYGVFLGSYFWCYMRAGDPVTMVLLALQAAEKVFGADTNSKGYKVPRSCGVIQGDGININVLEDILQAVMSHGYSAQVGLS